MNIYPVNQSIQRFESALRIFGIIFFNGYPIRSECISYLITCAFWDYCSLELRECHNILYFRFEILSRHFFEGRNQKVNFVVRPLLQIKPIFSHLFGDISMPDPFHQIISKTVLTTEII